MTLIRTYSLALAGLFILMGCSFERQQIFNKPVITVNEHSLSTREFANLLARELRSFDSLNAKDPKQVQRAKDKILQDFIVQSLSEDYALAQKIQISRSDLEIEINKHRSSYPDDLSFKKSLAQENISFSDWSKGVENYLLQKEISQKISQNIPAPSESEIKNYFDTNKERFKHRERIYISQIVVKDEAQVDALKMGLKTASFKDYAKKFSIAPEAKDGGLVGWIERGSVDFYEPLFTAPLNSLRMIQSPFGYHLARVEKRSPGGFLPLAEVRNLILAELIAQKEQALFLSWLDSQIRASKVMKNNDLIDQMKVETIDEN